MSFYFLFFHFFLIIIYSNKALQLLLHNHGFSITLTTLELPYKQYRCPISMFLPGVKADMTPIASFLQSLSAWRVLCGITFWSLSLSRDYIFSDLTKVHTGDIEMLLLPMTSRLSFLCNISQILNELYSFTGVEYTYISCPGLCLYLGISVI